VPITGKCKSRGLSTATAMPRSDEHAPLLETARVSSRGSRLDNRLALWGDSSNVKRAGFIVTLGACVVLGLVALVVVRIGYNLHPRFSDPRISASR
jgi:hypothetical protein